MQLSSGTYYSSEQTRCSENNSHYSIMVCPFFATEEDVAALRADFASWKEAGFPDADQEILALLEVLNQLPGVATTSSCSGHSMGRSPLQRDKDTMYVIAACTKEGHALFFEFFQRLMQSMRWKEHAYNSKKNNGILQTQGHGMVAANHLTWTLTQRSHKLRSGEELVYTGFAFRAKGTHLPVIRRNMLIETQAIANKLLPTEVVTSE